jgi:hypothetical protein
VVRLHAAPCYGSGVTAPSERRFDRSSRRRLNGHTAHLFRGDTLFASVARAVCEAECLPRKELFEAWEVAKRVRRHYRGGQVVELCAGHGLLAHLLLLLDDSSPQALCVDRRRPPSADGVARALVRHWPRLAGRVRYLEQSIDRVAMPDEALVVSVHACGGLSDMVLDRALEVRGRVALVPCCHALDRNDSGQLDGWLPGAMAIDVTRAHRLRSAGYRVRTKTIPADITPENRLLLGEPIAAAASKR